MDNEQVKKRKFEIKARLQELETKIGNPTAYKTANKEPLVGNLQPLIEERNNLLAEYNQLPNESYEAATLRMKKTVFLSDGQYTLKYIPEKNRWDFYNGNEYKCSNVTFLDDDNAKVSVTVCNSDTHGELIDYIYTIKVAPTVDLIVKKTKPVQPCSKIDEGLAAIPSKDDAYLKSMGLVKDANTGALRKQTPEEYDQQLKKQQKKAEQPKKKGFKIFKTKY